MSVSGLKRLRLPVLLLPKDAARCHTRTSPLMTASEGNLANRNERSQG
jgi:hypothetical protein